MISKCLSLLLMAWLPLSLLVAPDISSHSRLGINLSGIVDWNTEHPFVDVFRLSRAWISQKEGQPWCKGPKLDVAELGEYNDQATIFLGSFIPFNDLFSGSVKKS